MRGQPSQHALTPSRRGPASRITFGARSLVVRPAEDAALGRAPLLGRQVGKVAAAEPGWGQRTAPEKTPVSAGGMAMSPPAGAAGYTTVHTVFRVVSKRTALASVGFKFVSYMGFSKEACPLLFSCPA